MTGKVTTCLIWLVSGESLGASLVSSESNPGELCPVTVLCVHGLPTVYSVKDTQQAAKYRRKLEERTVTLTGLCRVSGSIRNVCLHCLTFHCLLAKTVALLFCPRKLESHLGNIDFSSP